jgi:hypothetical protein
VWAVHIYVPVCVDMHAAPSCQLSASSVHAVLCLPAGTVGIFASVRHLLDRMVQQCAWCCPVCRTTHAMRVVAAMQCV